MGPPSSEQHKPLCSSSESEDTASGQGGVRLCSGTALWLSLTAPHPPLAGGFCQGPFLVRGTAEYVKQVTNKLGQGMDEAGFHQLCSQTFRTERSEEEWQPCGT